MRRVLALFALSSFFLFSHYPAFGEETLNKDKLVVGLESTFPPFAFRNQEGSLAGLDVDLAAAIGSKLGKEIEIQEMAFDALIPSLKTGKIDLIISGLSKTPERAKEIEFSRPYYETPPDAFIVLHDSAIRGKTDLKGKIVAVQAGTTQTTFLRDKFKDYELAEVKEFPKNDDALREVSLGRADAALVDGNIARKFLREAKDFSATLKVAFREQALVADVFCIGIRPDDKDFLDAINDALSSLEEEEKLYELRVKYDLE